MPRKKMPELKPCPFCGCKAKWFWGLDQRQAGCDARSCWVRPYVICNTAEEAAAAWNTRKG